MSTRYTGAALLLLTTTALVAAGCRSTPPAGGTTLYACSSGDTLTVGHLSNKRAIVAASSDALDTLRRIHSQWGTLYRHPNRSTSLWTNQQSLLYRRNGSLQHYGCREIVRRNSTEEVPYRWFRSRPGPHGYGFVVRVPDSLQVSEPATGVTRFLYAGHRNDPPALTDGFTLTVHFRATPRASSLHEVVQQTIREADSTNGAVLSPPRDTVYHGYRSIYWRQRSALGHPITRWALALDRESVVLLSTARVGPTREVYRQPVSDILSTLKFWHRGAKRSAKTTAVPLAMLTDPAGAPDRGCDDVVFVEHEVHHSPNLVATTLDTLFALDRDSVGGARHFIQRTSEMLSLDGTQIRSDTVEVYLTGTLTGLRGACDSPRARIQIEETVRELTGLPHVHLYLNGKRSALSPSSRGQDD